MELVYDKNKSEYKVDFKDIEIFIGKTQPKDKLQSDFGNSMLLILDDYLHNKDMIFKTIYDELKDFYKEMDIEILEQQLGKPSYDTESETLIYNKNIFDEHAIIVEIYNTFAEPYNVSLCG